MGGWSNIPVGGTCRTQEAIEDRENKPVSSKAPNQSHEDLPSELQLGCFTSGQLYVIMREKKQGVIYLNMVNGFLERHQAGWPANNNNKREEEKEREGEGRRNRRAVA